MFRLDLSNVNTYFDTHSTELAHRNLNLSRLLNLICGGGRTILTILTITIIIIIIITIITIIAIIITIFILICGGGVSLRGLYV